MDIDLTGPSIVPGRHYEMERDGRLRCDVCPRECRLRDGQRGFCFVRARRGEEIVLTTWGRSSGFCIDPVEKKPLNHFLPGTAVMSFGTAGCNLGCKFCQNWDISKSREFDTLAKLAQPSAIARAAAATGCRSVAFTYNDPTIWLEYAVDTAIECHELGVSTIGVTAGYIKDAARRDFYHHLDAVNVDLKAFTEDFYRKIAFGKLAPVLESLEYLVHETDAWVEITTLVIPGENDSDPELHELTQWVVERLGRDVPIHFSAFHPDFKMRDTPRTPVETLQRARAIALENGVRYAYTGNVHDRVGDTTYCPSCGDALIVRDWYEIESFALDHGRCAGCGTAIAGVFEERAGTWGRRRQPVNMAQWQEPDPR